MTHVQTPVKQGHEKSWTLVVHGNNYFILESIKPRHLPPLWLLQGGPHFGLREVGVSVCRIVRFHKQSSCLLLPGLSSDGNKTLMICSIDSLKEVHGLPPT
ncbi:hypothetical protein AVEN_81071-1 [Araneus ventricosus]|uniref:Uncharacterized protein n=1 Tax=Araneus ventricosus TaxID=182803 RepID=A0A4Y2M693_ARAVE|nr:hypothetical protein AVEN_81071-1 [Araneus ventricosus]